MSLQHVPQIAFATSVLRGLDEPLELVTLWKPDRLWKRSATH